MTRLISTCFLLLIIGFSTATNVAADPEIYPGVVEIEDVQVRAGEQFAVRVWLNGNNQSISAVFVPLQFNENLLTLDSVSLAGTVFQSGDFDPVRAYDDLLDAHRLFVLPGLSDPLPSVSFNSATVMQLHFTADSGVQPQVIPIDTAYQDTVVAGGVHVYTRVEVSDEDAGLLLPGVIGGSVEIQAPTAVEDEDLAGLPSQFELQQNYPNPFNPTTMIEFGLPTAGHAKLDVFNILGQSVMTLVDRELSAGYHAVELDASNLPSGIYFYRLSHDARNLTRKMILLK
ncbi:T9SS type A sorting domain-containing protein [candidate division GN15 bacterium]|nr:T9SS type A sorting domain-containing protein [candidate division GN15 bacterium]